MQPRWIGLVGALVAASCLVPNYEIVGELDDDGAPGGEGGTGGESGTNAGQGASDTGGASGTACVMGAATASSPVFR